MTKTHQAQPKANNQFMSLRPRLLFLSLLSLMIMGAPTASHAVDLKALLSETAPQEPAPNELEPSEEQEPSLLDEKAPMEDKNTVVLRALDKITGRTQTFDVRIGETVKFGGVYVMPRACRKNPPIEAPENAAFLQIWEIDPDEGAQWIFSNWMFSSTPALSAMNHPVYDIWVMNCKNDESNSSSDENSESASGEDAKSE